MDEVEKNMIDGVEPSSGEKAEDPITSNFSEEKDVVKPESNPYAYLDREEFSSERFKIVVKNLPKFYGVSEFRKLLNEKLKLASNKIKFPRKNSPFLFVCFRNEEDRKNAISIVSSYKWKGKDLIACEAKPAPDPLVKKRNELEKEETPNKKAKYDAHNQEDRLKASTIPLWATPYAEQLKIKQEDITKVLTKIGSNLAHHNPSLRKWLDAQKLLYPQLPCELLDIRYSEQHDGYRNKCEFTVGMDEETQLPTVGFRIGSYSTGKTGVAPVDNLKHIPNEMKTAVKVFQEFVRSSDLPVFNPEHQTGNFRQLTIRSAPKQLMLVVGIHPQDLPQEKLLKMKRDLVHYFFEGSGKEARVTSLYYQAIVKKVSNDDVMLIEHLHGDTHIQETILGLQFHISPLAFFQINTAGAEILYKAAIELAAPTENSTVLDICCGTGTIGLCFAKSCSKVLGIEIIPQAVVDAKENAKRNEIHNCEFFAGKAEEILNSVLYRVKTDDVIAVVDPPRAGLHQRTIVQLRKAEKINKLVYVSCNPNAAMKNFIDLGRPESKTMHGNPFVPVKAVAVDLFPHTKHCELLIYFERWTKDKLSINENSNNSGS